MNSSSISLLTGPYEVKGRRGERFTIEDIRGLIRTSPAFFATHCQFDGKNEAPPPYAYRFLLNAYPAAPPPVTSGLPESPFAFMQEAVERERTLHEAHTGDEDDLLTEAPRARYFTLRHQTLQRVVDSLDGLSLERILVSLTNGDRDYAKRHWIRHRKKKANPPLFSGRKRGKARNLRHMRTGQEIRSNIGHIHDYGETLVRGKRRKGNLPDAWWDIYRPSSRSWKQKKIPRQWMKRRR